MGINELETKYMSFTKRMKSKGPKIEPVVKMCIKVWCDCDT